MAKLEYKLHITGDITVETGLHIGGSEVDLDIGGIDSEVIKIKQGDNKEPYLPGSSLKGKLRTLIGRSKGYRDVNSDKNETLSLFGGDYALFEDNNHKRYKAPRKKHRNDKVLKTSKPTRLIVRDSYLKTEVENADDILEDKAENVINRATGEANPRHLERVSKGNTFGLDMILDIYDGDNVEKLLQTIDLGFQILKRDYLGGSGTRGYGKVDISGLKIDKIVFDQDGSIDETQKVDFEFEANKSVK